MKKLLLGLTALEPLVITDGSAESMAHNCLDYIPGNMLLGAFAKVWLHVNRCDNPDASPAFRRLFLDGEVSWGWAVPVIGGKPCVPVPRCFMREKHSGGLPLCNSAADFSDIYNALPFSDGEDEGMQNLWRKRHGVKFDEKVKFRKINDSFMSAESFCKPDLRKVWNTRVALGKQRSALESQFFGFSALARGTRLQAEIYCHTVEAEADLRKLLPLAGRIHVGHARSAGYGRVGLQFEWKEVSQPQNLHGPNFNIYLLSAYLPLPAWESPLKNLVDKLAELAGAAPSVEICFLSQGRIDSFNGHWQRAGDSRNALEAGSVVRVRLPEGKCLPSAFELGAGQLEGYGRILAQPEFLEKPELEARPAACDSGKERAGSFGTENLNAADKAVIRLLRNRAIERLARRQALAWLHEKKWTDFVAQAAGLPRPTASQRNGAMRMDSQAFTELLDKSAAGQWQEAAPDPFLGGNNHLSEIMKILLDKGKFLEKSTLIDEMILPGGEEQDKVRIKSLAHEIFKRELARSWGKTASSTGKDK